MNPSSPIEKRFALQPNLYAVPILFIATVAHYIWALGPASPLSGRHLEPNTESQVVAHKDLELTYAFQNFLPRK